MGLNDPQWGNKNNNGGPPDLEELLRKLKLEKSNHLKQLILRQHEWCRGNLFYLG